MSKLRERNQKYRQKVREAREADPEYLRQLGEKERIRQEKLLEAERKRIERATRKKKLSRAELEEKAVAATAHHNELSAQIKATEKRMAEIAVLRTHIVNYAKTRETYVAYRKAGYSRKFREEHEQEILLHQAAKNAFDEMGVKKMCIRDRYRCPHNRRTQKSETVSLRQKQSRQSYL